MATAVDEILSMVRQDSLRREFMLLTGEKLSREWASKVDAAIIDMSFNQGIGYEQAAWKVFDRVKRYMNAP